MCVCGNHRYFNVSVVFGGRVAATPDRGEGGSEMIANVLNVAEVLAAKINQRTQPAYGYKAPDKQNNFWYKEIYTYDLQ